MTNLVNLDKQNTINSLEVAEMVGKRHADLLREIDNYISVIENAKNDNNPQTAELSHNAKLRSQLDSKEFFIPSTYEAGNPPRQYKCYNITKQGCEMIANKMTGSKGILFTAVYVNRFNIMEENENKPLSLGTITGEMVSVKTNLLGLYDGMERDVATVNAIELVANQVGYDATPLLKLAPPIKREVGYLTATDIGKRLPLKANGKPMTGQNVNDNLEKLGYQTFTREGHKQRKVWHLTDVGKQYGELTLEPKHGGGTVPVIKWKETIVDILKSA